MDKPQKVILTNMCQISSDDNILVLDKVSKSYSGVIFPGGHIEENEILTDAVVREVYEETGLHIKNLSLDISEIVKVREFLLIRKKDYYNGTTNDAFTDCK